MSNATGRKFGHPLTLVAETERWVVLARPEQVTLGSLVLVCREPITAFGDASAESFVELRSLVRSIENVLRDFVQYQKINYLMLMMVDPDVHFHVLPRYQGERRFAGLAFPDRGWPGQPALSGATTPDQAALVQIVTTLRQRWPAAGG